MIGSQFLRNSETSAAPCDNLPLNRIHCVLGLFGCLSKAYQLDDVYILQHLCFTSLISHRNQIRTDLKSEEVIYERPKDLGSDPRQWWISLLIYLNAHFTLFSCQPPLPLLQVQRPVKGSDIFHWGWCAYRKCWCVCVCMLVLKCMEQQSRGMDHLSDQVWVA